MCHGVKLNEKRPEGASRLKGVTGLNAQPGSFASRIAEPIKTDSNFVAASYCEESSRGRMKHFFVVVSFVLLAGCSRTPPYQQAVIADTPINFSLWRSQHSDTLTAKEWQLFDLSLDELKLKIMLDKQASGSAAIDQSLRTQIDGMKLCEVMLSGLRIRLKRLSFDKTILEESLLANSQLKLRYGDEDKVQALAAKLRAQSERLEKLTTTVAEAEADLQRLELKFR